MSVSNQQSTEEYILLLDLNDAKTLDYNKLKSQSAVFLEINIDSNYEETTKHFSEKVNFNNLQKLSLLVEGCKDLTNESYRNIGRILEAAKQVKELHIDIGFENCFNSSAALVLSESFACFSNLTSFSFLIRANNQCDELSMQYLASSFIKFSNLKKFSLLIEDGNQVEGDNFFQYLSQILVSFKQLECLELNFGDYSQFGKMGGVTLGKSFEHLNNLQSLNLTIGHQSDFSAQGLASLGVGISKMTQLQNLFIRIGRKNSNDTFGISELSKGIQYLKNLNILALSIDDSNQVGLDGAIQISQAILSQTALKKLLLFIGHFNNIQNDGGLAIGNSIQNCSLLEEVRLYIGALNEFGEEGIVQLAQNVGKQTELKYFNVEFNSENQIGNRGLIELGIQLGNLKNLKHIRVKIDQGNNVLASGGVACFQNWTCIQDIAYFSMNVSEIIDFKYVREQNIVDLSVFTLLTQEDQHAIVKGFSSLPKLQKIRIELDGNCTLDNKLMENLAFIYCHQDQLLISVLKSKACCSASIAQQAQVFRQIIQSKNLQKAEMLVNDQFRASIDNQNSKKRGQKLFITVYPYNKCGQEGSNQIAEIIKLVKKSVKNVMIQINVENSMEQNCGKVLMEQLLACQYLTQVTFQIYANATRQQVQQIFNKMSTIIQKCVTDRERVVKTYLLFFQKALVDYPRKQRGSLLKNVCQILPLMKEFNLPNNVNNQQFGFGNANQYVDNLQFQIPVDMDDQEDEWNSDIEENAGYFE